MRHWNVLAAVVSIPLWVLVLAVVASGVAVVAFVAVACFTAINLAALQWRIARERRG